VQAILFDRDGVLTYFDVDAAVAFFQPLFPISVFELAARWQTFGAATGFPRSLAEEKDFFTKFWKQLSDEFKLEPVQLAALENLDYTRFVVPYPEVRSVLNYLHAQNIRLGVLSNFSLASLEQSLVTTNLAAYFDTICAATVIGASKPSAQAYEIAVQALQVEPKQCLFFDDELGCVEGARKLGMRSYLVDRQAATHDLQNAVVVNLSLVPLLVVSQFDDCQLA
jgi:HAD superfamily hydrolase (TIGR01509 family)